MHAYMKGRAKELGIKTTRINQSGCLERCEMGPTMVIYPEGVWYTYRTKEDIDEILQSHVLGGKRVHRLQLMNDDKLPKDREARLAATKTAAE
jgi:(2Fe-2S) ferredoxin